MTKEQVKKVLDEKLQSKKLSYWKRGVILYAYDLLEYVDNNELPKKLSDLEELLLNDADNWQDFSWGGYSLIYEWEICERLSTPSKQKRKKHGLLKPNRKENWLDVQVRALTQACQLIYGIVNQ